MRDIALTIHPHPTRSETVGPGCRGLRGHGSVRAAALLSQNSRR
jgi:hypothetical protein